MKYEVTARPFSGSALFRIRTEAPNSREAIDAARRLLWSGFAGTFEARRVSPTKRGRDAGETKR
jgi:hypothetical protein